MQACLENSNLVTLGQKFRVLNVTEVRHIVKGDIKLPYIRCLQLRCYPAVRVAEEVQTLGECAIVLRYTCNA
jgi:hypothetical protein